MLEPDPEVVATFQEESAERLASVESGLLNLEKNSGAMDPELLRQVFRDAHSLKAAANLLGFTSIERLAHRMENTLDMLRNGRLTPGGSLFSALLEGVDGLREMTRAPGGPAPTFIDACLRRLDEQTRAHAR